MKIPISKINHSAFPRGIRKDLGINRLPDSPGVYFFIGKNRKILYIGKAVSLKNRVKSYFGKNLAKSRSFLIESLVEKINGIKYQKTDSVLEALILEANLIKKYQPKYNTQEKDDKSWNYVVITKEESPRVLLIRGKELQTINHKLSTYFGPFPHGRQLKEALKIIRKIFPFQGGETKNLHSEQFYQELGLAPILESPEAKKEYKKTIRHLKLFFEGKKKHLLKNLGQEMKREVKKQNFERAAELRNKIFALKYIHDVSLIKNQQSFHYDISLYHSEKQKRFRIEAYDISHISGKFVVGGIIVLENNEFDKSGYRKFKIKIKPGINDIASLKEILARRLKHKEWILPHLIVVDGGVAQKRVAESTLKSENLSIPVVAVIKDKRHKARLILGNPKITGKYKNEILKSNMEVHRFTISYHRHLREKIK